MDLESSRGYTKQLSSISFIAFISEQAHAVLPILLYCTIISSNFKIKNPISNSKIISICLQI